MGLTPSCDTILTFNISNAANIQELPDVCYGSGNYAVVWTDLRDGTNRIVRVTRVTPQWAVMDTGNVVCSDSYYQITPVIAFDGTRYLAVWQDLVYPFGIQCRFIGQDGLPQDSVVTLSSASSATNPRICHDGVNYLVVWQEYTTTNHIIGRFISPAGSLIGDAIMITSGPENHVSPALCHDGDRFLVTWSETQIHGQFLSSTGSLIGAAFQSLMHHMSRLTLTFYSATIDSWLSGVNSVRTTISTAIWTYRSVLTIRTALRLPQMSSIRTERFSSRG